MLGEGGVGMIEMSWTEGPVCTKGDIMVVGLGCG